MNDLHSAKFVQVIAPVAIVDDASWTTLEVDTLDYDFANFVFNLCATDIAMAALKLQHSDTSGSGFADITGANCDGGVDIEGNATALPSATDDGNLIVFQVDLRDKKRYLDLVATAGNCAAGTFASATCILTKAAVAPTSVSATGAETIIRV